MMITDHSKANDELAAIAKKNDIKVPDSTTLTNQAKEKILDMRDQSFDAAYANNQVKAHEQTIELFKKEANTVTDDKTKGAVELKGFAQKMLPGLEKHLDMAKTPGCAPKQITFLHTKRPHHGMRPRCIQPNRHRYQCRRRSHHLALVDPDRA